MGAAPDTDYLWDVDLTDDQTITVAGEEIRVLHTPGHAPGAVCLSVPSLGCVFTGDTLFEGGPGATGRSYSDADLIKESIRARLFALPDDTVVHTGHGPDTTIGAERANLGRLTAESAVCRRHGGRVGVSADLRDSLQSARLQVRWPLFDPQIRRLGALWARR